MRGLIFGVIALLAASLLPLSATQAAFKLEGRPKVAMLHLGTVNDGGWSEALDRARVKTEEALGLKIAVSQRVPEEWEIILQLVDRYVRRVTAENTIADAVDFFHTDALSAAVPMKIDLDVQLTLMADALYRLLGRRLSHGLETATPRTLFRKLVRASATVEITADAIVVTLGRRAQNPLLLEAGYADTDTPLPWLDNRTLRIRFG